MFKPGLNVKKLAACSAVLLVLQSGMAQAHGDAKGHSHQHDAHVHGVGELEMVQEGQRLSISMYSPLHNLLGFERAPRTDAERARMKAVNSQLRGGGLFTFTPAAQCQGSEVRVRSEVLNPHVHAHEGKDAHTHDGEHSDVKVIWEFECANPAALKEVKVNLFQVFPRFEALQTQAIFAKGQVGAKLSAKKPSIQAL